MANSYYQTPTTPKLYVSYPLWQYASGALDDVQTDSGSTDEDLIRMIQLDPSKITNINIDADSFSNYLKYRIVPASDDFTDVITSGLWNFDYCAILGHNLASVNAGIMIQATDDTNGIDSLDTSSIVNHNNLSVPTYDGWSLFNLDEKPNSGYRNFQIRLGYEQGINESPISIGSIMYGKAFTFPQSCNLSTTLNYDYGVTQKQSVSGKTISTANWTKPNNWITEPFGLTEALIGERGDNFQRRSGRRTWKISFDSLAPDKVMNQMPMMNSNGWTKQDNQLAGADGLSSYNINNAVDFYTNVVNKTMGGHLPMMLQIDKDDPSPQNMAIVRLKSDFQITQKSPNLYNIKLDLVEQI
tara:strand:+ start:273 stop:1340 length:1068 start_codon:yes stop_codon:yes gene_type:complete